MIVKSDLDIDRKYVTAHDVDAILKGCVKGSNVVKCLLLPR